MYVRTYMESSYMFIPSPHDSKQQVPLKEKIQSHLHRLPTFLAPYKYWEDTRTNNPTTQNFG